MCVICGWLGFGSGICTPPYGRPVCGLLLWRFLVSLIHISLVDLAVSFGFIILVAVLARIERLGIGRSLAVGAFRALAQLMAVGYILKAVFDLNRWYWVVLVFIVMTAVAAHAARKRQTIAVPRMYGTMLISIALAGLVVLGTLLAGILRVDPWYRPQYVIPLSGIVLASAMNATALTVERFLADLRQNRTLVEAALTLGAAPKEASRRSAVAAMRTGMMSHINTMSVVGIVQLPGMMTGQILGGVAPSEAVRYQIVILYCLVAGGAIASLIALAIVRRQVFTRRHQLCL
jgi:putative ABC transport system permease protein